MPREDFLDEIHLRILRVTEDLRMIQQELNYAVMEAPGDPELMEMLTQLPEMESLEVLKSALDQMRHFLWFYKQVIVEGSEEGDDLRQVIRQAIASDSAMGSRFSSAQKAACASEALLLHQLLEGKNHKPN
jgi:hypothetical protein